MDAITIDPAREVPFYFRINRNANPVTITVVYADGSPYPVSTKTWELNIKKKPNSTDNTIQLLSGTGLTIGSNTIVISPTAAQTNVREQEYYWELYNLTDKITWLTGIAYGHRGRFDGVEQLSAITVNQSGTPVTLTISVVSGSGGGQSAIQFEDEGSVLGAAGTVTEIDFVGAGVSAARVGDKVTVSVSGGGGGGHIIENSGTPLTARANLNFTNGLTASDNTPDTDVKLGGLLTANTTIDVAGNLMSFDITDGTFRVRDLGTVGYISLDASGGAGGGIDFFAGTFASNSAALQLGITAGRSFNLTHTGSVIFDDQRGTPRGIEYLADYSATYNTLSLIDKGYADGAYWKTLGNSVLSGASTVELGSFSVTGWMQMEFTDDHILLSSWSPALEVVDLTISYLGTIFTDSRVSAAGIEYGSDYSATYTSRSLIDKGYADGAYWSLATGGTLTGAATIETDGNTLILQGTAGTENQYFTIAPIGGIELLVNSASGESYLVVADSGAFLGASLGANSTSLDLIDTSISMSAVTAAASGSFSLQDQNFSVIIDPAGVGDRFILSASTSNVEMVYYDDATVTTSFFRIGGHTMLAFSTGTAFAGIEYNADHSVNFTDRSLIDKGFADATYALISGGAYWSLATGGTLTGSNIIDHVNADEISFENSFNGSIIWQGSAAGFGAQYGSTSGIIDMNLGVVIAYGDFIGNTTESCGLTAIPSAVNLVSNNTGATQFALFQIGHGLGGCHFLDSRTVTEGIQYSGDYSADFTARSLIDRGFADATYALPADVWLLASTSTLTADVSIEHTTANELQFYNVSNGSIIFQGGATLIATYGISTGIVDNDLGVIVAFGDWQLNSTVSAYSEYVSNGYINSQSANTGGTESVYFTLGWGAGATVFQDFRTVPVGIQYGDNYSATFATRSLIDKGFADTTYAPASAKEKSLIFVIGDSSAVSTGAKTKTRIMSPYTGTIVRWKVITDTPATITLDVWKAAGAIPINANSITAAAKPSITADEFNSSSTLTGWTTAVAEGDILELEVEANNNANYISLALVMEVTA